ncbi:Vms1/Ankzf1 family peptidyl-tRNA hydrolase [Haloplanus halophilus]|uniref:Vms1/Ankzf1 family peptidyl-tRNA hydrolase n=1 Tax=Haloplanus halophilus TaxID=2949993 RepID=UPI00203A5DBB|nr:Vms1/Ankzf1 family peptidyl-tRNA hydrolase [Haloplanus sp. GDY1]
MLDSLLGRAELKARIEELEEEKRHLERRLDAESDRRADAVTARQEAEERVNRLEDRVADLEGRLDDGDADAGATLAPRGTTDLRGDRLDEVLARLRSVETGSEGALTAMVGESVPDAVADALGDRAPLVDRAAPCLVCTDDAGLVSVALAPPLAPAPFVEWGDGFRLDSDWFHPPDGLTVALVRSDLFAVGRYDGGALVDVETVETDVQGSHSKGGFSQARFERRRDEQVAAHLEDCRDALDARDPDSLVLLGERTVLDDLDREASAVAAVDATGEPEAALHDAVDDFFTTRLTLL